MKICVFDAGAIGGYMAGELALAGHEVCAIARGAHLARIEVPMLFLQGTRDEFATPAHLAPLIETLGERAQLTLLAGADHSFHVPARSERTAAQVRDEMLAAMAAFSRALAKAP